MKSKQFILGMCFAFLGATSLTSCDSKKENKAEEVQEQKEEVIEAQNEGDTSAVREEQAELDSARKDYREAARDSLKKANN